GRDVVRPVGAQGQAALVRRSGSAQWELEQTPVIQGSGADSGCSQSTERMCRWRDGVVQQRALGLVHKRGTVTSGLSMCFPRICPDSGRAVAWVPAQASGAAESRTFPIA